MNAVMASIAAYGASVWTQRLPLVKPKGVMRGAQNRCATLRLGNKKQSGGLLTEKGRN